jgi:lysophospholipase L1-like esterase
MKNIFLSMFLTLTLTGCGGGGTGNSVTVSGGGSQMVPVEQKIVFTGASSIARGNWSSYFGIPIENDGVSGIESGQLANNISGQVNSKPDKIFIMIGGNNILNRHEGVLLGDISTIIDRIRETSKGTKIYIHSILPVKENAANVLIEYYNNQIQSLCAAKDVKFLSVYGLFKSSSTAINLNYYIADGIHLTDAGYKAWANAIKEHVLSL